ncbi:hypothetical protein DXG01_016204, partial [Tephrocybe rancida]
ERKREEPELPQLSELTTRPKDVPIDFFSPDYWNNIMTVRERADCRAADGTYHVALPLEEFCGSWKECAKWKNLSDADFMERYGKEVLKEYDLPTEEELKQMEEWEARYGYEDDESDPGDPEAEVNDLADEIRVEDAVMGSDEDL